MGPVVLAPLLACAGDPDARDPTAGDEGEAADWLDLGEPVACDAPSPLGWDDVGRAWGLGGIHDPDAEHANGAGAGVADLDGDGDLDVVLAYPTTEARVFWRDGDAFVPGPTLGANGGRPQGIGLVDADGDGRLDVAVNTLDVWAGFWHNAGDGTFTDATRDFFPTTSEVWATPVAADWDRDGDVDAYLPGSAASGTARVDRLLRNDGTGRMEDVTAAMLPPSEGARTFQAMWLDADGDMAPEVYGVNDQGPVMGGNVLYRNTGAGFEVANDECYCATPVAGMSGDAGDVDGDGLVDIWVGNSDDCNLYRNDGAGGFYDVAVATGATECEETGDLDMVWGSALVDHDNDGDLDIFAVHGDLWSEFDPNPPMDFADALLSQREDGTFEDVAPAYGLDALDSGRSIVADDHDGDGVLDFLVTVIADWPHLWRSRGCTEAGWLEVEVAGPGMNPLGIGARVEIEAGGRAQVAYLWPQSGLGAAHEPRAHFGLGDAQAVDRITVTLPTGERKTTSTPFPARRRVTARF